MLFADRLNEVDVIFTELLTESKKQREARLGVLGKKRPELAAQVRALLEGHQQVQERSFLGEGKWPTSDTVPSVGFSGGTSPEANLGMQLGVFQIRDHIASGGMGHVFSAGRTQGPKQQVAIKILKSLVSESALKRFQTEARFLAKLSHPGIVPLIDVGTTQDGRPYIVMPLIRGERIDHYCQRHQSSLKDKVDLLLQVCDAVQHAHENAIIHRDLKPSNVLVEADGRVFTADFGLGKHLPALAGGDDATSMETTQGNIVGTPQYLAPELQAGNPELVNASTDVYGLGATLYALVAGRAPHEARTIAEALVKAQLMVPVSLRRIDPAVPKDLSNICAKCLEVDPAKRYSSAVELGDDLRRYQAGLPVRARPISVFRRAGRWAGANRLSASLLIAIVLLVCASFYALTSQLWHSEELRAKQEKERQRSQQIANELLDAVGDALAPFPEGSVERRSVLTRVVSILHEFTAEEPEDEKSKHLYGVAMYKLGLGEFELGNEDAGLRAVQEAHRVFLELAENNETDADYAMDVGHTLLRLRKYDEAYVCFKGLAESPGANKFHKNAFADSCAGWAESILKASREPEALENAFRLTVEGEAQSRELWDVTDHRQTNEPVNFRKPVANNLLQRARVYQYRSQHDDAAELARQAVEVADAMVLTHSSQKIFFIYPIFNRILQAEHLYRAGRLTEAITVLEAAADRFENLPDKNPVWRYVPEASYQLYGLLKELYFQDGQRQAAAEAEWKVYEALEVYVTQHKFNTPRLLNLLILCDFAPLNSEVKQKDLSWMLEPDTIWRPADKGQSQLIEMLVKYRGNSKVDKASVLSELNWQLCSPAEKSQLLGFEALQMAKGQQYEMALENCNLAYEQLTGYDGQFTLAPTLHARRYLSEVEALIGLAEETSR